MKQTKTTIAIEKKTREGLDSMKIHPRQTYDEAINNLIEIATKFKNADKMVKQK